jgi:hypothetical protein
MAARRTVATLMIALSIFVMLTLVLAVTTYIYVQQAVDQTARASQVQRELESKERDLAAERQEKDRLRDIIGTAKETADTIEAEFNDFLQTRFAAFPGEPRSLRSLVDWLGAGMDAKDKRVNEFSAQAQTEAAEKTQALAEAQKARETAEKAAADAAASLKQAQESFEKSLAANVAQMNAALTAQKEALAKAERLEAITTELEKLGPALSPDLRRRFTAPPPDGQPTPWPERVRFVYRDLLDRQKAIQQLNTTLARLGAADPETQRLVLDAQPYDERIDGFDGRIAAINSVDKTVTIITASTAGLRPGLVFYVYDPDDPRPEFGNRKGAVEVIAPESGTRARGRITSDTVTNPILAGDGVATTLWSPGQPLEIAIVGYVSFPGDGGKAPALLRSVVERAGGALVDSVSPQTSLIVDGGTPPQSVLETGPPGAWRPADEARRKRALEQARDYGIRVVGIDTLLEVLGLDRSVLSTAEIKGPEAAPAPARPRDAAVAY